MLCLPIYVVFWIHVKIELCDISIKMMKHLQITTKKSNIVKTENINSVVDYTLLEPQLLHLCKFNILRHNDIKT